MKSSSVRGTATNCCYIAFRVTNKLKSSLLPQSIGHNLSVVFFQPLQGEISLQMLLKAKCLRNFLQHNGRSFPNELETLN